MSTPVRLHAQTGSRPGGLTGHDLMSIFPPPQSTPSYSSSLFGREEREYLSSRRDEHALAHLRARIPSTRDDSSSSASGSDSASSVSLPHSRVQRAPAKTVSPTPAAAPKRAATNYQTQVHLDQGSGDSQFLVMRMSLASMSNTSTPDCHFSEFRATQYPPRTPGKQKRS